MNDLRLSRRRFVLDATYGLGGLEFPGRKRLEMDLGRVIEELLALRERF